MNIKEENNKPQNLKYKIGEKEYSSMNEVAKSFAGTIKENTIKKVIIEWYWDFYSDDDHYAVDNRVSIAENHPGESDRGIEKRLKILFFVIGMKL